MNWPQLSRDVTCSVNLVGQKKYEEAMSGEHPCKEFFVGAITLMYLCCESASASYQNFSRVRIEYQQEGLPPSVKPA